MNSSRSRARRSPRVSLVSAAVCAVVLTGCSAGAGRASVQQESPESQSTQAPQGGADDTPAEGGADRSLPSSFPGEVPLLPYDITDVRAREEAHEYRIRMVGAAAPSDAETARAQFNDAGFTETLWNDAREGRWSGLFELDGLVVKLDIRDAEAGAEIEYNVGRH